MRLQRNAIDLVEQDHLGRRERSNLRHQLAGGRIDHLKTDDFGRLQVGTSLQSRKLGIADRGQDHAKEGLPHAGHAAQQQIARVDLPFLSLVVGRRNSERRTTLATALAVS